MSRVHRVVLSAAYGMGNLGDEAICEVAVYDLLDLDPNVEVTVLAWHTDAWRAAHLDLSAQSRVRVKSAFFERRQLKSVRSIVDVLGGIWSLVRCHCLIWGGGGIVRDRPHWLRAYLWCVHVAGVLRKQIIVLSVGVEAITRDDVRSMLGVLQSAGAISVRDVQSRVHLLEAVPSLHGRVEVISDGAFRWPQGEQSLPSDPAMIGVNLSQIENRIDDRYEEFLDDFAVVLKQLHERHPLSIVFLPTVERDCQFADALAERLPAVESRLEHPKSPQNYVRQLEGCRLFVGMRMHSLVLASRVMRLPFCGFIYSAKVAQLCANAKAESFLWPLAFDQTEVVERMTGLLDGTILPPDFSSFAYDALRQRRFLRAQVFTTA